MNTKNWAIFSKESNFKLLLSSSFGFTNFKTKKPQIYEKFFCETEFVYLILYTVNVNNNRFAYFSVSLT